MNEVTLDNFDFQATATTRARYQRIEPFYDALADMMGRRYLPWRQRLWSLVRGPQVLEVGVGTGKNIPFYRRELDLTAVDLTPGMLVQARRRAEALDVRVQLCLGDVQALDFPDGVFDSVVATFVFCSVPNPVLGLTELHRVVKPGGQVLLLEHTRSAKPLLGKLMDILNPVVVRITGANINRRTLSNVTKVFQVEDVEDAGTAGRVKLIIARAV
jgi:phosphatidylethanolamine/phosphatidyl-N-methylethanolamine N-methyltransferase